MDFLERIFRNLDNTLSNIKTYGKIYVCRIDSNDDILLKNINRILIYKFNKDVDKVNTVFNKSISIIPKYVSENESRVRIDVLLMIARELGYFPFAGLNDEIYISTLSNCNNNIVSEYNKLNILFNDFFGCGLIFSIVNDNEYCEVFKHNMEKAYEFYVENHRDWINNFINKLGDEISKISFKVFLRQRIMASVFDNSPICYPVLPPEKTATWRKMRENSVHNFPILYGASREVLNKFFYKYVYVYEQYAIPGVIEVQEGDTVVDVGAFIGDTACYFSKKAGSSGKVLSFEISPESISFAKKNMEINGCSNVKIIPYALSDKSGYMHLSIVNGDSSSNSVMNVDNESNIGNNIKVITLDEYCEESKEKIDFIKADIEGSEMAMLKGAGRTISKDAPVCAICLYHKRDDFWEIPQFLKKLCPEYTFFFRCEAEPVLFSKIMK